MGRGKKAGWIDGVFVRLSCLFQVGMTRVESLEEREGILHMR